MNHLIANQRHKSESRVFNFSKNFVGFFFEHPDTVFDWNNKPTADGQLLLEIIRDFVRRGRNKNAVIWRLVDIAFRPVRANNFRPSATNGGSGVIVAGCGSGV